MDMTKRFVARVYVDAVGKVKEVKALDNSALFVDTIACGDLPPELIERIALLRLCEINHEEKGELVGRKFSEELLYLYLSYDEYKNLTNKECRDEFT